MREEFDGLTLKKGRQNLVTKVNAASQLITLEEVGEQAGRDGAREGTYALSVPAVEVAEVDAGEFEGDIAHRRGMGGLAAVDEITMLCVPDLVTVAQRATTPCSATSRARCSPRRRPRGTGSRSSIPRPTCCRRTCSSGG